jgi:hypothetical protein
MHMTKSRTFWAVLVLTALIAAAVPNTIAAQSLEPSAVAGSEVAAPPAHIMMSEVPMALLPGKTGVVPEPRTGYSEQQWKQIKARAAAMPAVALPAENRLPLAPARPAEGALTPGGGIDILGANENLACSGLTPSDMGLAVSSVYIVQITNACVEVFNHAGGLLSGFPKTLNAFFNRASTDFTFDPRILYDWQTGRFIATGDTISSNQGYIDVAVSESGNAAGGWYVYSFPFGSTGEFGDFPTVGQTDIGNNTNGLITICANIFVINGGFVTTQCDFLNKFYMYEGAAFSYHTLGSFSIGGVLLDTMQPANLANPYEKPRAQFLVSSYDFNFSCGSSSSGCNGLTVWSISNALPTSGSPGLVWGEESIATPSNYTFPANADQPGSNNSIDTNDLRISGTVPYSGGFLYPTINVGNGGTSAVLGWKVAVYLNDNGDGHCTGAFVNACPTLDSHTAVTQEFCYACGNGHNGGAWFGDIGVTPEGNWTMSANWSTQTASPGTFITSNRVTWPTPFHDGGNYICQAQNGYTQGRWGDYTASAADVEAKGNHTIYPAVWSAGMYVPSSNTWGTCIASSGYVQPTDN